MQAKKNMQTFTSILWLIQVRLVPESGGVWGLSHILQSPVWTQTLRKTNIVLCCFAPHLIFIITRPPIILSKCDTGVQWHFCPLFYNFYILYPIKLWICLSKGRNEIDLKISSAVKCFCEVYEKLNLLCCNIVEF